MQREAEEQRKESKENKNGCLFICSSCCYCTQGHFNIIKEDGCSKDRPIG